MVFERSVWSARCTAAFSPNHENDTTPRQNYPLIGHCVIRTAKMMLFWLKQQKQLKWTGAVKREIYIERKEIPLPPRSLDRSQIKLIQKSGQKYHRKSALGSCQHEKRGKYVNEKVCSKILAHRYATFFCSWDDSLVGQLTSKILLSFKSFFSLFSLTSFPQCDPPKTSY